MKRGFVAVFLSSFALGTSALSDRDVSAWQTLFDEAGGSGWRSCNGKRDSPCNCALVTCQVIEGAEQVVEVALGNIGLSGSVPGNIVERFSDHLRKFDVSGSLNDFVVSDGGSGWSTGDGRLCVDSKRCSDGSVECSFPASAPDCADSELGAWRALYDQTGGANWVQCSEHRDDPCSCEGVDCIEMQGSDHVFAHISHIVLPKNNMVGDLPDLTSLLPELEQLYLYGNDLSADMTSLDPTYGCFQVLDRCFDRSSGVDCGSDASWQTMFDQEPLCGLSDLGAWRLLFDSLHENGGWRVCDSTRDDPCACKRVNCEARADGYRKLREIFLRQVNLLGELPVYALDRFEQLDMLELHNSESNPSEPNFLTLPPGQNTCIASNKCLDGTHINCEMTTNLEDLGYCASDVQPEPPASTSDVVFSDQRAWELFYDTTGGSTWRFCSGSRHNPCSCNTGNSDRVVRCAGGHITSIRLRNNFLVVDNATDLSGLNRLPALTSFSINNNAKRAKNTFAVDCINYPRCALKDLDCTKISEASFCTAEPAPTNYPTFAPTPRPTSVAPTMSPTTSEPTANPTTPLPSRSPTGRPSASPTTTPPSTGRPTTSEPTQSPTKEPTTAPTILWEDQRAWESLYDLTDGANWRYCSRARSDPCSCNRGDSKREITCVEGSITKIRLRSNKLRTRDSFLPIFRINSMPNLVELVIDNAGSSSLDNSFPLHSGPDAECINIPACAKPGAYCAIQGATLCHETLPPSPQGTAPPQTTTPLLRSDQQFFERLYNETGGQSGTWVSVCDPLDPCSCGDGIQHYVQCSGGRIKEIVLPDFGMQGEFPADGVAAMDALDVLVVSGNSFSNGGCISIPDCQSAEKICDISNSGLVYCVDVVTNAPTPFPTRYPTTPSGETARPSSSSPSARPSSSPTHLPTAPTSPTIPVPSSSPSVAPSQGPRTPSPTSLRPSLAPTSAPIASEADYACRVRFVSAKFGERTSRKSMHRVYLERAFPKATVRVENVREGSVIVDFRLLGLLDSSLAKHGALAVIAALRASMTADERRLLTPDNIEVNFFQAGEDVDFPMEQGGGPGQGDGPNDEGDLDVVVISLITVGVAVLVAIGIILTHKWYTKRRASTLADKAQGGGKLTRKGSMKIDDHYESRIEQDLVQPFKDIHRAGSSSNLRIPPPAAARIREPSSTAPCEKVSLGTIDSPMTGQKSITNNTYDQPKVVVANVPPKRERRRRKHGGRHSIDRLTVDSPRVTKTRRATMHGSGIHKLEVLEPNSQNSVIKTLPPDSSLNRIVVENMNHLYNSGSNSSQSSSYKAPNITAEEFFNMSYDDNGDTATECDSDEDQLISFDGNDALQTI